MRPDLGPALPDTPVQQSMHAGALQGVQGVDVGVEHWDMGIHGFGACTLVLSICT